jgi:hypothetical protein
MSRPTLTKLQLGALATVYGATRRATWHRAASSGERVTLASLHTRGLLQRRARRGAEGEANAAYEYQVTPMVLEELSNRAR